jgi:hypothetical protein
MASKALSNQVTAKWQDSFNRLNRAASGISGLMEFSRVRRPSLLLDTDFVIQLGGNGPVVIFLFFSGLGDCRGSSPTAGAPGASEGL